MSLLSVLIFFAPLDFLIAVTQVLWNCLTKDYSDNNMVVRQGCLLRLGQMLRVLTGKSFLPQVAQSTSLSWTLVDH